MAAPRSRTKEELYGEIKTNILTNAPEPETDVNVKRGLTWAIGGTAMGAFLALFWFIYRLFSPIEGVNDAAGGGADYIVIPVLATMYSLIGAVVGGCLGMSVGIVYMAIAAYNDYRRENEEAEDDEDESLSHGAGNPIRGLY